MFKDWLLGMGKITYFLVSASAVLFCIWLSTEFSIWFLVFIIPIISGVAIIGEWLFRG